MTTCRGTSLIMPIQPINKSRFSKGNQGKNHHKNKEKESNGFKEALTASAASYQNGSFCLFC